MLQASWIHAVSLTFTYLVFQSLLSLWLLLDLQMARERQFSLQSVSLTHHPGPWTAASHSLSKRALVATVQLDCLGPNEVKRHFPALDPGVQQLLAAEGRH
jgi:hypothetical protein